MGGILSGTDPRKQTGEEGDGRGRERDREREGGGGVRGKGGGWKEATEIGPASAMCEETHVAADVVLAVA